MIKVLIADDEEKVCTLIYKLVNWQDFDMEVVATVYNGIEALECIKALELDLVITDIRMPGYDGIELIAKAKEINDRLEFIIISGYRHFEYAQSAIKYGVSDYLLKPIKKEELIDTLKKIRLHCLERAEQLSAQEQLRLRLQDDTSKHREQLFADFLFSSTKLIDRLEELNKTYCFQFVPGVFQLTAIKIDCPYEDFNADSMKVLSEKVSKILDSVLRDNCYEMEMYYRDSIVYTLLNYSLEDSPSVRRQLKAVMAELLVQQTVFDKVFFTLGVGKPTEDVAKLPQCFSSAQNAVFQRLVDGTGKMIDDAPVAGYAPIKQDFLLGDFRRMMSQAVELLDLQAAQAAVGVLADAAPINEKTAGSQVYKLVVAAGEMFMLIIKNTQYNVEIPPEIYEEFKTRLSLCGNVEQLFETLNLLVRTQIDFIVQENRQADNRPIRMAKEYIQKNYMNPIGLEEISEMLGFNLSYFSALFKKETGKNFLEYLTEVRIANAKELLRETNLSIAEICNRVGYLDQKHFIATFKKYAGIKPGEFRKLYS
ncbi:two-component system response regulator YesN [Hydrogenispora ethanolica]|uniref:Two-component system response regulator YesN n=1 Tax=Hydrogenispora ethanolica TaxID=1082276 RepID=A0A4R1RU50_HYDET|nr:response regulator [Hydrogenispora ethanolica]TCL69914.1 two-component system response regulator YesN [Hydrogenispora ethanolica]